MDTNSGDSEALICGYRWEPILDFGVTSHPRNLYFKCHRNQGRFISDNELWKAVWHLSLWSDLKSHRIALATSVFSIERRLGKVQVCGKVNERSDWLLTGLNKNGTLRNTPVMGKALFEEWWKVKFGFSFSIYLILFVCGFCLSVVNSSNQLSHAWCNAFSTRDLVAQLPRWQ